MGWIRWLLVSIFLVMGGCTEYNYHPVLDTSPDIEVEPEVINFGNTEVGDTFTETLTIRNRGLGDLELRSLRILDHDDVFQVGVLGDDLLSTDEEVKVDVVFTPPWNASWTDDLRIKSNDPDENPLDVAIRGNGAGPEIFVDPTDYTFLDQTIGCEDRLTIKIKNIGGLDLEIYDIRYFSSVPSDFDIDLDLPFNQSLPWTLNPGEHRNIYITYSPMDGVSDLGTLEVVSNDAEHPTAIALQRGDATPRNLAHDSFEQDTDGETDILFVIDNSGSMSEYQAEMAANLPSFVSMMDMGFVDYQIGIITTDSPLLRGPLIHPGLVDPVGEFTSQALVGTWGDSEEMGLEMGYQHLLSATWLRPGAPFNIVYVSDEPDGSPNQHTDYADHLLGLKSNPDDVAAHSIVGGPPTGCGRSEYGAGYYEVSLLTGGSFISICSSDWAAKVTALASLLVSQRSFALSQVPLEGTITVWVNGVETSSWVYDPATNSVVFDFSDIPPPEADIEVEYGVASDCP